MEFTLIIIFKTLLIVFSGLAAVLSLVFMLQPSLFSEIEEILGLEIGTEASFSTVLEGRIMVVHDWVYQHHVFLGPLLAVIAAWNTRNAYYLI